MLHAPLFDHKHRRALLPRSSTFRIITLHQTLTTAKQAGMNMQAE